MKLQNAVLAVVNWRLSTALEYTWQAIQFVKALITRYVFECFLTVRWCVCWMTELAKTDTHLATYFTAVVFLHVAHKIPKTGFSDELTNVLATVSGQCNSQLSLSKAIKLMKVVASDLQSTAEFRTIKPSSSTDLSTSELVDLLQQSAIEHLTTYRQFEQFEAREFGSVATIVTTDFEALYAYKHGDYQRCLQLSTQNVHTLLYAVHVHDILISSKFIHLLDDDIVSLTALTLIVVRECWDGPYHVGITQLTLSLYLMTQCQLKLRHSVTSLAQTLNHIKLTQRKLPQFNVFPFEWTLEQLTLKLAEHKALTYIIKMCSFNSH